MNLRAYVYGVPLVLFLAVLFLLGTLCPMTRPRLVKLADRAVDKFAKVLK